MFNFLSRIIIFVESRVPSFQKFPRINSAPYKSNRFAIYLSNQTKKCHNLRIMQTQALAQILDPKFYENATKFAFEYCSPRTSHLKSGSSENDLLWGGSLFSWMTVPEPPRDEELSIFDATSSANTGGSNSIQGARVPAWKQEPTPLAGWTKASQQQLMQAAKEAKLRAAKGTPYFRKKLGEIAKRFPNKTAKECEECFLHVESSRVVYFGAKTKK